MSAGWGPERESIGTSPRTGRPRRSDTSSAGAKRRAGRSQGGKDGRVNQSERDGRQSHCRTGVRRGGREWCGAQLGQDEDSGVIAVGHFHDASGRRVGVGLCRFGVGARRVDRHGVRARIAHSRDRHRHVAIPGRHDAPRLRFDHAVLGLHDDLRDLDLNGTDAACRIGRVGRRLCRSGPRWPRNASPAPPCTQSRSPRRRGR